MKEAKLGSKDTGRGESRDVKSNNGLLTKRDEIAQDEVVTRKELAEGGDGAKEG